VTCFHHSAWTDEPASAAVSRAIGHGDNELADEAPRRGIGWRDANPVISAAHSFGIGVRRNFCGLKIILRIRCLKRYGFTGGTRSVEPRSGLDLTTRTRTIKAFSYTVRGGAGLIGTYLTFAADNLMLIAVTRLISSLVRTRALV